MLAGHAAKQTFANVVAADLFERALEAAKHLDDLPSDEIGEVAEALGDVCELFASYERAASASGTPT